MSEGVSDNSEDINGVLVGDRSEGDKDDAILIPDQEVDLENMKGEKFPVFYGICLMIIGGILFSITSFFVLVSGYIGACPVLWNIIGIFVFSHGLIVYFQPPKIYSLEVVTNGKQFISTLPIRHILVCMTNTICSTTGIIAMCTLRSRYNIIWNIIGLVLSIPLLLVTLISVLASYSKTGKMIKSQYFNNLGTNFIPTEPKKEDFVWIFRKYIELFRKLLPVLPLPSVQILNNLDDVLKEPRLLTNKPVHVLSIILAMVACIAMFVSQLWDITIAKCNEGHTCFFHQDPEGTFARSWVMYGVLGYYGSDRKLIILVSTPITFLLCTTLLLLLRKTTVLRMILSGFISLGMGIFFFLFSIDTSQYIILLGTKMSTLSFILKLVSLMPIPLLAALFMSLAYSNMIQMMEENEDKRSGKLKAGVLSISIILAIVFFFLSLTSMVTTNLSMIATLQGYWGDACNENEYPDCHGELDYQVQNDFTLFSISQVLLTESFLLLSVFITMTGRRITKQSLFFPGLLLFAAASSTITAYFCNINNYVFEAFPYLKTNGMVFLILPSVITISSLILGFFCVVTGGSVFISFITIIFRVILSIFVLAVLVILTVLDALLNLASQSSKNLKESKVEVVEKPEVTTT
eukprot:GFUD01033855.1.p1 GENE.GFUD01033855.1~~GFUD01033855.1.p1  ORF type:complete len:634 (-),score=107.87 GFUD01033855.1:202-2103(-)